MSRRISLHLSEQSEKVIASSAVYEGQKTDQAKRVNFIISAYDSLLESPLLSYEEWIIIIAAAKEYIPQYTCGIDVVLHDFSKKIVTAITFGKEFESIDKQSLSHKFKALPKQQQLFAFEVARKAWLQQIENYKDFLHVQQAMIL